MMPSLHEMDSASFAAVGAEGSAGGFDCLSEMDTLFDNYDQVLSEMSAVGEEMADDDARMQARVRWWRERLRGAKTTKISA